MTGIALAASAADAGIAGPPDTGSDAALVVALGAEPFPAQAGHPRARFAEDGGAHEPDVATIAPRGEGLWSRGPWPAADALFDLPAPEPRAATLVTGSRRDEAVEKLAGRKVPGTAAGELTAGGIAAAAAVIVLADDDEALPARAMAVLAARRVLIAPRCATSFGLQPGLEYLGCTNDDDAVEYAYVVRRHPEAFDSFRALGALAAERHRASRVYERLAAELTAPPRSAAPRG